MQDDDAPERLSRGSDPELRAALRSMVEYAPQTARVARVAQNVGLATGVRPELLLPPSQGGTSPASTSAFKTTHAHTATSAFGAGAKIVAASVVVVTAGLLGHWAITANGSSRSAKPRTAAVSALSSRPHATAIAASSARSSRGAPPGVIGEAPKTAAPPAISTATAAREPARQHPPHLERKPDRPQGEQSGALDAKPTPSSRAPRSQRVSGTEPLSAASASSPAVHDRAAAADELGLLHLAQSALQTSPAQALHLAAQHRNEFPRSALAQERELIEISALVRLGRRAEARGRAERFRRAYPRSAYERQLSVILPER
ncbi:MAG TPA: hypothetical protein VI072_23275 [Polyangiaceae bacterium]